MRFSVARYSLHVQKPRLQSSGAARFRCDEFRPLRLEEARESYRHKGAGSSPRIVGGNGKSGGSESSKRGQGIEGH